MLHSKCLVQKVAGLAYQQAVEFAGSKCVRKFQLSVSVGFLHNVEYLYILQQINVNVSVCIKDIKTTLLIFLTFLWTSLVPLRNNHLAHFFTQFLH